MRRVRVSQVVEANAGLIAHLGEQADEFGSETGGLERLTVHLGDDVGLVRQPDPDPQKLFSLGSRRLRVARGQNRSTPSAER